MANHTLYENFVLENKVNSLLNTKLQVQNFMTIDEDLKAEAGTIKKINVYSYEGSAEAVAKGAGNTGSGIVSFKQVQYEVATTQHTFTYHDEDVMQDDMVIEVGIKGGSEVMAKDLTDKFFEEIAKTTLVHNAASLSYDAVVDAIALMNLEEEGGLFLLINPAQKAEVRKDPDFKSVNQGEIIYKGQIGSIAGIPVVVSKAVTDATLATKEAVTCFVKKEAEVEQDRDIKTRTNDVVIRKVNLVALTDATKAVKIAKTSAKSK